jgi:predicted phosphodiesterase
MKPTVSDEEFIALWKRFKSAAELAKHLNVNERNIHSRRVRMQKKYDIVLGAKRNNAVYVTVKDYISRATAQIDNGVICVASDAHYWDNEPSTAHQAFVKIIKQLSPEMVILNGDVFDGASISRYPRQHWGSKTPTVKQELEAVQKRLSEIEKAAKNAKLVWTLGNHDQRFESRLVAAVPEFEGVVGFTLKEHFPRWLHCMSLMINNNIMVKHRYRTSVHATYLNTLHAGVSIVTGHLHRLQATMFADYKGTRFGIDTGTLGDVDGDHMGYGEDNPKNHCSGAVVLTIKDGELLYPEFCYVRNGVAYFRGVAV